MEFYRYDIYQHTEYNDFDDASLSSSLPHARVKLMTFNLHRETPGGYWIGYGKPDGFTSPSKWVSKYGKKRYAYPTKEEALLSFYARKKQQVRILGNQLRTAEMGLIDAESMLKTQKSLE